jgi:hypothetical protein
MSDSSRRGFLKVAGAGVAAAGVAAVVPSVIGTATDSDAATLPHSASGSMLVHVSDVRRGEMQLMVEGREVTVHNPKLVAQLAAALHSAAKPV